MALLDEPRTDPTAPFSASSRRELGLGLGVLAVLAVVAWLSTVAINGLPFGSRYEVSVALPADGPILGRGDDVRVGGRRIGTVSSVSLGPGGRGARATLRLDDGRIGPGAAARVRLRGLAGAVYVDLQPGDTRRPLASGATIAAPRVRGATQLSDVVASFDGNARAALRTTLRRYGQGVSGRGLGLNRTLAQLPGTLGATTPLLRAVLPAPGALTEATDATGDVAAALTPSGSSALRDAIGPARQVLAAIAGAGSSAAATSGTARGTAAALGASLRALPGAQAAVDETLPEADTLLASLEVAANRLRPGVRALDAALPSLTQVEQRRARLDDLAALARLAAPVVRRTVPLLQRVRPVAGSLGAATRPMAELARYLAPYKEELFEAPAGFTRWGDFTFPDGQASGARAVRFSMILSCANRANPYPRPGAAAGDRKACG